MSDAPLNKEELTKLFRKIIKESGKDLEGDDRMLANHLSNVVRLNDDFGVDDKDHIVSLKYLNEITGVLAKFDEEVSAAIVKELGL